MKQKGILWVIALAVLLVCGCTKQEKTVNNPPQAVQSQPENQDATPEETVEEDRHPAVLKCAEAQGYVTPQSAESNTPCLVRLTKHRSDEPSDWISYNLQIEVETGTQTLKKELSTGEVQRPAGALYFGDVDGDGTQEILVHHEIGGLGGFGLWQTWVLKVEDHEIRILFENFNTFDTGFESRFLEGYQMEVKNPGTGYTLVFDVKQAHRDHIEKAGELPQGSLVLDPFYVFEPKDVDHDGISEIICKQYTAFFSHADYTGTACSVLKFNKETQSFQVVDAWYEPNSEG